MDVQRMWRTMLAHERGGSHDQAVAVWRALVAALREEGCFQCRRDATHVAVHRRKLRATCDEHVPGSRRSDLPIMGVEAWGIPHAGAPSENLMREMLEASLDA